MASISPVAFLHSKAISHGFPPANARPSIKRYSRGPVPIVCPLHCLPSFRVGAIKSYLQNTSFPAKTHLIHLPKSSNSDTVGLESENPIPQALEKKGWSFESVRTGISRLTPLDICKWSAAISIAVAASRWTVSTVLSPFFWVYFSWTWVFWPWFVAIAVGIYGLFCFRKHLLGEANVVEQIAIVTSAFTWLTLVPPAHVNGFLQGWPFVFFFAYHYFFFFNVTVRRRLYGDLHPRPHDPKWDLRLPTWCSFLFCAGVMAGHWFAAFEAPELHLIPGGWSNVGIWVLIMMAMFMQYHSTWYLAKYSEKVVEPTAVVQFGPYRWVRHPIYSSTMLIFWTYCLALRAPISSLFITSVCALYYGQKAKLEEALMVETFGERYTEYTQRVKYKLIPFVY